MPKHPTRPRWSREHVSARTVVKKLNEAQQALMQAHGATAREPVDRRIQKARRQVSGAEEIARRALKDLDLSEAEQRELGVLDD